MLESIYNNHNTTEKEFDKRLSLWEAAQGYIAMDLDPLPIPPIDGHQTKGPVVKGWVDKAANHEYTAADYLHPKCNIGILLGGKKNAADVDCDALQAVALARIIIGEMMAETGKTMMFGRRGKRRSHYIFYTDKSLPSAEFRDPTDDEMVIEYRCVKKNGERGEQTVFPPSVRCDKITHELEAVTFEDDSAQVPVFIESARLFEAYKLIGFIALLAKHLPVTSGRNRTHRALAGCFARHGMPEDEAVQIVTLAYSNSAGYNNDIDKAEADVRGVYKTFSDDPKAHLFGYSELIEHVPKVVVDKLFKWLSIKFSGKAGQSKPQSSIPLLADNYMSSHSGFYEFGGTLVEPMIDLDTNVGSLHVINTYELRHNLRNYFKEESELDIRAVAEHILAKVRSFSVQRIRNIVTTPTFRPDFSMVVAPGFDEASRLYYLPDESLRTFTFTTDADRDRAKEGVDLIFELLSDFPFKNPDERYNYLAILLTLFMRSAMADTHVPCLALDGNGQSVGKGLLCSMLSLIAYGKDASFSSQPNSVQEWESKLDAILVSGSPFEVIDNIMNLGSVSSGYFASVLMSTNRSVRIKGLSKNVSVPVNVVWVINGNHLSLDGDLAQRVIMCHLQHEAPESRNQETFKIQQKYECNIETLLARERARYMQACIDIVCGWVNAGSPRRKNVKLAKYDTWESIIGGIMDWIAPEARFLADQKASHEMDSEHEETVAFLYQLIVEFPMCSTKPIGASEIAARVFSPPSEFGARSTFECGLPTLRDVLPAPLSRKTVLTFANKLGRWLKAVSTKRWGTITLEAVEEKHNKRWTYRIHDAAKDERPATRLCLDSEDEKPVKKDESECADYFQRMSERVVSLPESHVIEMLPPELRFKFRGRV